jgi:hypothetical protein
MRLLLLLLLLFPSGAARVAVDSLVFSLESERGATTRRPSRRCVEFCESPLVLKSNENKNLISVSERGEGRRQTLFT